MSVCPRHAVGAAVLVLLLAATAGPTQGAAADKSGRPYLGVAVGPAATQATWLPAIRGSP